MEPYSQPPAHSSLMRPCALGCMSPAPQPPAPLPPATAPRPASATPIVSSDALTTHEARLQPRPQQRSVLSSSLLFSALFLHSPPRAPALSASGFPLPANSSLPCVPTAVRWCPPVPCGPLPPPQTPTACYRATSPAHYKVRIPTISHPPTLFCPSSPSCFLYAQPRRCSRRP